MKKIYKNPEEAKKTTERFRGEFVALVAKYGFCASVLGVVVTVETGKEQHKSRIMLSCIGDLSDVESCIDEISNLPQVIREKVAEGELYNFPEVIGE